MNAFVLYLQQPGSRDRIDGVHDFIAEDASGSFGIRPGHERMITVLSYGLAQYRGEDGAWTYLAVPGGLLYFVDNELYICSRRLSRHDDPADAARELANRRAAEELERARAQGTLKSLEREMLKRLLEIGGEPAGR